MCKIGGEIEDVNLLTTLYLARVEEALQKAKDMGFIKDFTDEIVPTQKGLRFVDEALLLLD